MSRVEAMARQRVWTYLGWYRSHWTQWLPAILPDSDPPVQIWCKNTSATVAEESCLALTRTWLAEMCKRQIIDIGDDGEVWAGLAGTPPVPDR